MGDPLKMPDKALAAARAHSSFRTRIGHLSLLIVSCAAAVGLASLLVTENGLPDRTFWALVALTLLNIVWAAYAGWVLAARRTLLFNHRVIATRIALGASALFTLGSAATGVTSTQPAAYVAAIIGLVLTGTSAALVAAANRQHSALLSRRADLSARLRESSL